MSLIQLSSREVAFPNWYTFILDCRWVKDTPVDSELPESLFQYKLHSNMLFQFGLTWL